MAAKTTQKPIKHKVAQNLDTALPLSAMQRNFVMNLVHNKLNNSAAARAAGYSHPAQDSQTLLKNSKIRAAIAEEREEYAKASGMTKQKVIDGFAEAIDIGRIKADPIAMIAGWREIGKMCGFYEPTKSEIRVSLNGKVLVEKLNSMSDDELLALTDNKDILEGEYSVVGSEST